MTLKDMTEVKRDGRRRRRTQLLDNMRKRRRYWELKKEADDRKSGNYSLSHGHKEEIQAIFHKPMDLLIIN
jgi:hypothetical protein